MKKLSISFESFETKKRKSVLSAVYEIPLIPERSISIVTPLGALCLNLLSEPGSGLLSLIKVSRTRRTVIALEWEYPMAWPELLETMSTIYPSLQKSFDQSQSNVSTGEEPLTSMDGEQTP